MNEKYLIKFIPELAVLLIGLALIYFFHLNQFLFRVINPVSELTGTYVWANITILGDALVSGVVVFLFIQRKPELVWTALIAAIVTTLLVHTLKPMLDMARPPAVLDPEFIYIIGPAYRRHAFPSGHSASIFTVIGVLMIYNGSLWQRAGLMLGACTVAVSRIVVGVHWPTDVFAGAAIGLVGAAVGYVAIRCFKLREYKPAQLVVGGLLLVATLVLLTTHNTHYKQAIWLQRMFACAVLTAGSIEYVKLMRSLQLKRGTAPSV